MLTFIPEISRLKSEESAYNPIFRFTVDIQGIRYMNFNE